MSGLLNKSYNHMNSLSLYEFTQFRVNSFGFALIISALVFTWTFSSQLRFNWIDSQMIHLDSPLKACGRVTSNFITHMDECSYLNNCKGLSSFEFPITHNDTITCRSVNLMCLWVLPHKFKLHRGRFIWHLDSSGLNQPKARACLRHLFDRFYYDFVLDKRAHRKIDKRVPQAKGLSESAPQLRNYYNM